MKNALIAVAITALMGGLVIAPVTQQSAQAQVYSGLKSTSGTADSELLTLVGHGGGGHGGAFHMGGGHMGGGHMGGHMGGGHMAGGGRHWGGGHPHVAYGGGGNWHSHYGNWHGHNNNWHANNWAYNNHHHHYYRYGRYYRNYWWYGGAYAYGYGNCAWLYRQAVITGSPYWWQRYNACIY